ncbi:hypothetical protein IGI04_031645, partial [Brassica rapa subsp. trilocularis]
ALSLKSKTSNLFLLHLLRSAPAAVSRARGRRRLLPLPFLSLFCSVCVPFRRPVEMRGVLDAAPPRGVKRSRRLGFGYGGSQFYFADPVVAFGLEACGGVVDSLPVVVVFVVSKRVLRCGEEYRASLSFRLVVLSIGQSDSFLLREAAVCSLESVVYGCAPLILVAALPLLNHPHFTYQKTGTGSLYRRLVSLVRFWLGQSGLAGVGGSNLKFSSSQCVVVRARCFKLSGSVAAVASACSFRVAFHALCGVNYKPGFGGFARSRGKYLDLPSIARLALHDSEGYKLRGVHRDLATPETTQEFPASEATRRTSHFCDSSSMVRTTTGF